MAIAVCLYIHNEAHFIVEWIAHHVSIGFDTILICDNRSNDGTVDVALGAGRLHDIRVLCLQERDSLSQADYYNRMLKTYGPEFEWMAFLDVDEFILPVKDGDMKSFLRRFSNYTAVALNWAIFGSNGFCQAPKGLVLEKYTQRAEDHFPSNRHVKSVIRPAYAESAISRHVFKVSGRKNTGETLDRGGYVDANGRDVQWGHQIGIIAGDPQLDTCRINHYYTRSRQDFWVKARRKWCWDPKRAEREFFYNDRNEVRDMSAAPFATAVHALADQIRPSVKFTPAKYGSLPTIPFGSRFRDYVEPEPKASQVTASRDVIW